MSDLPPKLLSMLMISGAQTPERAIRSDELAKRFGVDKTMLEQEIEALGRRGYVVSFVRNDAEHLYLSQVGILAASSVYS